MPSWSSVWIPGVVVANVLGFALLIYSWEHAFGLVSSFKKRPKIKEAKSYDDDEGPKVRQKLKRQDTTRAKSEAVAIDVKDQLSIYPVVLAWDNVECKVFTGDATAVKQVLHKCSGFFLPSEFVALMGPSGAGKSTMLDVLAGRKHGSEVKGSVTLNGLPINPKLANRCISYVGQEDIFMPMLTVWESLYFVAQLRVKPDPEVSLNHRMRTVLETLGMSRITNSKVGGYLPGGTEVRGISGGEKRRLSIACGLVGNPSILFLDEPTTGLDSHAALAVMRYLDSLTHLGHTIISTIHQPRQEIFASFDKLLLLSEGHQMYLASPEYVLPWFRDILNIPYRKEVDGTVADWLLGAIAVNFQTTNSDGSQAMVTAEQIKSAAERFKQFLASVDAAAGLDSSNNGRKLTDVNTAMSEIEGEESSDSPKSDSASRSEYSGTPRKNVKGPFQNLHQALSEARSEAARSELGLFTGLQSDEQPNGGADKEMPVVQNYLGDSKRLYVRGWTTQFWVLYKRFMLQQLRNPTEAGIRLLTANWSGIFFGLVWVRIPNTADSAQTRLALIFFALMMYSMVPFAYMAFPAADKRFFSLDSGKGLYAPSAYFIAYNVANAPFMVLNSFGTGIALYGLVGLRYQGWAIVQFNLILGLHGLVSNQLLVFTIWFFAAQDTAFSVATIYITFSLLICGFYIRVSEMTLSVMRGISWGSYCKYTFQALAYTELRGRTWDNVPCVNGTAGPGFGESVALCNFNPEFLLYYYDFRLPVWKSTISLLAIYIAVSMLCFWGLLRIYKNR